MSAERFRTALAAEAARLRIEIPPEKLDALCVHYDLLRTWNTRIRLVGTVEPERAAAELFADSLIACEFALGLAPEPTPSGRRRPPAVIDIGSGAGLPGIPIKIMQPCWDITLIDSDAKRVAFLKQLARALGMSDIRALRGRAEEFARDPAYRERFDLAFCRAVAAPPIACELALPFLAPGGSLVLQTTVPERAMTGEKEPADIAPIAERLSATIGQSMTYSLPSIAAKRMLLHLRKTGATPREFPRDFRMMKKHPLA